MDTRTNFQIWEVVSNDAPKRIGQITNSFYKALKYWVFTDYAQIHCRDSDAKLLNNFNYHMTGSKIQNWDFKINFCSTFLDTNTPSLQW